MQCVTTSKDIGNKLEKILKLYDFCLACYNVLLGVLCRSLRIRSSGLDLYTKSRDALLPMPVQAATPYRLHQVPRIGKKAVDKGSRKHV